MISLEVPFIVTGIAVVLIAVMRLMLWHDAAERFIATGFIYFGTGITFFVWCMYAGWIINGESGQTTGEIIAVICIIVAIIATAYLSDRRNGLVRHRTVQRP